MRFAVTVGHNGSTKLPAVAAAWAKSLQATYLPRPSKGTLAELLINNSVDSLLVATNKGPQLFSQAGTLSFHPGMAVLRLQRILKGEGDHFCEALGIKAGMRVLDCTLGLASDAAIASYVCGAEGLVVGVEASPALHFLVREGLATYEAEDARLTEALRRIQTVAAKAEDYLPTLKANSFDVVYFDPMFQRPVAESSNMQPLRPVACEKPLTKEMLTEALRVAPVVVVKERTGKVFAELGITEFCGGRYSRIKYGIKRR